MMFYHQILIYDVIKGNTFKAVKSFFRWEWVSLTFLKSDYIVLIYKKVTNDNVKIHSSNPH